MPFEVYDNDGNPVEGVLPPEEIKSLQEKLEETNQKLSKLEKKDFDYRRLENMTEAEKEKLSATELSLKKQQEELEDKQKTLETTFISDVKKDLISSLVGDDEELRKKIELNYDRLSDSSKAKSREEIKALLNDAYVMSVGIKYSNPILNANNVSGSVHVKSEKISEDIKDFGKKLGLTEEDLEKI